MAVTAAKLNVNRDIYEVSYDTDVVKGETVSARFENASDVSVTQHTNDGSFIVTVAEGYEGEDEVTVEGSDSGEDTGTITFGA